MKHSQLRFKSVRIKSVLSGLFHKRKQKVKESVEEYANDLNRLYQHAYPYLKRGSADAEKMGQTVLAYQFVAGLKLEIRLKVAGHEGSFEQLLMKARLEEAKLRDYPRECQRDDRESPERKATVTRS